MLHVLNCGKDRPAHKCNDSQMKYLSLILTCNSLSVKSLYCDHYHLIEIKRKKENDREKHQICVC